MGERGASGAILELLSFVRSMHFVALFVFVRSMHFVRSKHGARAPKTCCGRPSAIFVTQQK
jgi:hypothetical protein